MVLVEICVESVAGARAAARAGAARAELCAGLAEGGTTPSSGALALAAREAALELVALVRPRGGDFLYGDDELAVMEADVLAARELGLAAVALGCLTADGAVDEERTGRLVERARPMDVVFHRAFDLVRDADEALEVLVHLGIARVLSSGQAPSALEGAAVLARLVRRAAGRITLVAAGGIRPGNVREVVAASGVGEVHLSASSRVESLMRHQSGGPRLASAERAAETYAHWDTDERVLRELFDRLR